jgi:flagellar biosynthesis chaperone FliJ
MGSRLTKRRLEDVQRQLSHARESLAVLEEQVAVWNDALDDARIRALVSETPLQSKEYDELSRHVQVANAEMQRRSTEVRELMAQRDELLREWTPKDDNG